MNKIIPLLLVLTLITCTKSEQDSTSPKTESTEQAIALPKTENIEVNTGQQRVLERLPLVDSKKIRNIIFMIGDGTGLVQITSGQLNIAGRDGRLYMQTMPVIGLSKTYSADNLITDSAAGGTAFSCGEKTNNGMLGQLPDGTKCKTILEMAEEKGLSTALVVTSGITHATPAAFASHVVSRNMQDVIAEQYLDSGVDVFLGGGYEYFIPNTEADSKRKDERNLLSEFESKGYEILKTKEDLSTAESDKLLGVFAKEGLERTEKEPALAAMTAKALDVVSQNEKGFFMMVEGSQIDWGGHANDAQYVLREVKDFDEAVKVALDFAVKDGETLVVLTADHETGGMTLQEQENNGKEMQIFWTSTHHTGVPVAVLAYGPEAIQFTGWQNNIEIGQKMAKLLGVGTLPSLGKKPL